MRSSLAVNNRIKAYKIICVQFVVAMILALFFVFFFNKQAGFSALLGGLVCILPIAIFARYFFSRFGARQSQQIMKALFVGEAIKIALTIILFVFVIKYASAQPLFVLIGFIISQLTFWLAPMIMKT